MRCITAPHTKYFFKFTYKRYGLMIQLLVHFGPYNENRIPAPIVHRCHLLLADKSLYHLLQILNHFSKVFLNFS